MITLNGKPLDAAGKVLSVLLKEQNFKAERIVVEVDLQIIPKSEWDTFVVSDECTIEVVSFVGGG